MTFSNKLRQKGALLFRAGEEVTRTGRPKGWERGRTEENIPYYMNHAEESTQWDHPKYSGMEHA